jgi:hypothetical protein
MSIFMTGGIRDIDQDMESPIRTDCVTIFLMLWLEVVPSAGIGILPPICAWPPRGCTIYM